MADDAATTTRPASRKLKGIALVVSLCLTAAFLTTCIVVVLVVMGKINKTQMDEEIHFDENVAPLTSMDDDKCGSGKMFVGSANDKYGSGRSDGIYLRQTNYTNGRPQYKHESKSAWLYYGSNGYWMVVSSVYYLEMRVRSKALRPNKVTAVWSIRIGREHYVEEKMLKVVCVDDSFVTCHTGKLQVSNCVTARYNGYYFVTFSVNNNRPVYQHENGDTFLLYGSGEWRLGTLIHFRWMRNVSRARDFASRPEYVVHEWLPDGASVADPLRIRCADNTKPDNKFLAQPERKCHLPFSYRGRVYKTCTKVADTKYWCSHTSVYSGDWSYCNPAMTMHAYCVSPFEYKGRDYKGCTKQDSDKYWCSLTDIYRGFQAKCHPSSIELDWRCVSSFVHKRKRYHGCTKYKSKYFWCSKSRSYAPRARVYCNDKGIVPHPACKFPFRYGGQTYYRCAMGENTKPWCSTTQPYNGTWKYCEHYTF